MHAVRALYRRPGFTLAAGLSLAFGIGITTAMFTVLNVVALRPLPYADPDRLVWMTQILKANSTDEVTITPDFLDWRRLNRSFTDLAAYGYRTRNLTGLGDPAELRTARASAVLFSLIGVHPIIGRHFTREEDIKGRDLVAILSHELWQQRFGGDPQVIGRSIVLDGQSHEVVGVLPRGFLFPGADSVQLITPLGKDESAELQRKDSVSIVFNVLGRLKPGVTAEQAWANLTAIQANLPKMPFNPSITIKMLPLRDRLFADVKTAGVVLVAAAGFLLLIACANASNLLLVRLLQRDRELAIRTVLGGSRAQLIGQLLAESAIVGALACAGGILIAWWIRIPLLAWNPYRLAGLEQLPFDARVFGFAAAVGLATTLLFGLMPAFRATEVRLADAMKAGSASVVGGRRSLRVLSWIVTAEIAIVVVLSTGASLMLQSFWKLRYTNLGFQSDRLVSATFNRQSKQPAFMQELLDRAKALPGVEAAAVVNAGDLPPGDWHATNVFSIEGRPQAPQSLRPLARYPVVSPDYFGLLKIPLLEGRLLADSDQQNATPAAVVNLALARRYFPGQTAIGQRVRTGPMPWRTIVGIVGDVKTSGLSAAAEPTMYFSHSQMETMTDIALVVRSPLGAATLANEIRRMITQLDRNQPIAAIQTMDERLTESVSKPRMTAALMGSFAWLAVLFGMVGVYGVMGCRVRWQIRELALRQALGAQRRDVIGHVLRQALSMVLPGCALGLAGSLALGRVSSAVLLEVPASDPRTLGAVAAGLTIAALGACWFPAMRAARVDPIITLRQD